MSTEAAALQARAPTSPQPGSGELSHRQILTILLGLTLGMFLAALDQTVVATAIRVIADDLGGLSQQAWATTAFLITGSITTPLYGKLSDIYGRKPLFLFAISIFLIGSVLCTFSTSMYELAGFRAVQGLGAGGLFTLALTILGDIVPPRERARYQGYILAVFGTSSVLGPVIGGVLSGQATIAGIAGWRWIFLVNVPIGAVALFVVARVLNIPHTPRRHRVDWPGAVALAVFLVPLLIVAEQGREWGWDSTRALVSYLIGAVGLVAFLLAERAYGDDALLPLRLFRNRMFALTSAAGIFIGMGMFGGIVLLPLFLQIVHGVTPTESGFLMVPLVGGIMVGSVVSGQITARTGRYKVFPIFGAGLMVGALLLMHFRVAVHIPLWELDLYMVIFGVGLGNCMQTLVLAVQNAVSPRDLGVATASSTFFRQIGGTLGTAIFLSIVFSTVGDKIGNAFQAAAGTPELQSALADPAVTANPANQQVIAGLNSGGGVSNSSGVLNDSSFLKTIDDRLAEPFRVGFSDSMTLTFLVAACVLAVAFVLVLFIKELPLRTMSGMQARAAEEAETPPAPGVVTSAAGVITSADAESRDHEQQRGPRTGHTGATVPAMSNGHLGNRPPPVAADVPVPTPPGSGPLIFGTVQRADARGLADAVVTVTDPAGQQEARTATGGDGDYQLPVPHGGTYLVVAASGTFQPHAAMVAVADRSVRHDITLTGASGVYGIIRTVLPGGGSRPVAGIAVTLIDARGSVAATVVSDQYGRYHVVGVPDGQYTLTAAGPSFQPVAVSVVLSSGATTERDVELPGRARLLGTVVAESTGYGVAEALATLIGPNGAVVGSAVTEADGSFVFDDLAEGGYTLTASGYAPVATLVQVTAGGTTTTEVALVAPTDGGTAPPAGPDARLSAPSGDPVDIGSVR